ncbi:MAG: OmpA family protein, partial [Phycisphaerales bacterium]|nr:OmpA family protein [Phycisphaerales bacterium]
VLVGFNTGCSQDKVKAERDQLLQQNQQLKAQLAAASAQEKADQQQLQQQQAAMNAAAQQQTQTPATAQNQTNILPPEPNVAGQHPAAVRHHHYHHYVASRSHVTHERGFTIETHHGVSRLVVSSDLLFASASARLHPSAERTLLRVAHLLRSRYAGHRILIEGYTDSRPIHHPYKSNYALGLARARSVEMFLGHHGVSRSRMRAISFGSEHPRSRTDLALNRRVEIVVLRR